MSHHQVPTGTVFPFAGTVAPFGYLLCNGAAVSRTDYAKLFAVIGVSHGYGNNSTTFNIPDYRGRFLRGHANGSANDPDRGSRTAMSTGGNSGDNVGSIQGHAFQDHNHTQNSHTHFQFYPLTSGSGVTGGTYCSDRSDTSGLYYTYGETCVRAATGGAPNVGFSGNTANINQNTGASGSTSQASTSDTRPVNAYVNYIIKI